MTVTFFGCVKLSAAEGDVAKPVFGPSGVLPERIERGDHVDVFASARSVVRSSAMPTKFAQFPIVFRNGRRRATGDDWMIEVFVIA